MYHPTTTLSWERTEEQFKYYMPQSENFKTGCNQMVPYGAKVCDGT